MSASKYRKIAPKPVEMSSVGEFIKLGRPDTVTAPAAPDSTSNKTQKRKRLQNLSQGLGEYWEYGRVFSHRAFLKFWRVETNYALITLGLEGRGLENHLKQMLEDQGIVLHCHQNNGECIDCKRSANLCVGEVRGKSIQCTRLVVPQQSTNSALVNLLLDKQTPRYLGSKNHHVLVHTTPPVYLETLI